MQIVKDIVKEVSIIVASISIVAITGTMFVSTLMLIDWLLPW